MKTANVTNTVDLNYNNGYVECACGWYKNLGNGFNGYHIDACPACTPELETRNQRKVITGGNYSGFQVTVGNHVYFVISNGIHVQYSRDVAYTTRCATERQADLI